MSCATWLLPHFTCFHGSCFCRRSHCSEAPVCRDADGEGHFIITVCTCVCSGNAAVMCLQNMQHKDGQVLIARMTLKG